MGVATLGALTLLPTFVCAYTYTHRQVHASLLRLRSLSRHLPFRACQGWEDCGGGGEEEVAVRVEACLYLSGSEQVRTHSAVTAVESSHDFSSVLPKL